jgi:hypothetical protein
VKEVIPPFTEILSRHLPAEADEYQKNNLRHCDRSRFLLPHLDVR